MTPPSACFCLYLTGEDPAATSRNRPVAGTQIASNGARPVLQSGARPRPLVRGECARYHSRHGFAAPPRRLMLLGLTIRDFVLIERLDLAFKPGLCVLTGETGAGKSILLDALGLALGMRAESGLVRRGASQAVVAAEFAPPADHPVWALLAEHGIDAVPAGGTLVLRRILGADGRSRAFIDDAPASVGLLRQAGDMLVEIQGQFEQHGLLDQATHRDLLDAFGGYERERAAQGAAWRQWREIAAAHRDAAAALAQARRDEDYLRHALAELDAMDPKPGEEDSLADTRALLMHREKLIAAVDGALGELAGDKGAERGLTAAARLLERAHDKAGARLDPALAAVERALVEAQEAVAQLETLLREDARETGNADRIEERLFALRALARKHNVAVDGLAALRAEIAGKVAAIEDGGGALRKLAQEEAAAREEFLEAAKTIGRLRRRAALRLDKAVGQELAPLRLDKARFQTAIEALDESEWNEHGQDRIGFAVATNPGAPPGPLARIASGGELSRLMLALKVVLARGSPAATLVFDEVDSGIGGAVAAAVGERLFRLGERLQILVVTHSPQVAAIGAHHWRVAKEQAANRTSTSVAELSAEERREEIARMLSGAAVTAEARAAADSLIAGAR
jgi:DNA repair protein RecN (Recombination protein N)